MVEAARQAIAEETDRSTGTVSRLAHARQVLARRGEDPATETEIASAVQALLDRAGQGPGRGGPDGRNRRVVGRTRADHGVAVADVGQHRLKPRPSRRLTGHDVGEHAA